jgi:hypothetical protein
MFAHPEFPNSYAADRHLFGVAAQSSKDYLSPSSSRVMACFAALLINAIR